MSSWLQDPIQPSHTGSQEAALARQNQLTKPTGSLGYLEQLVVRLAGLQGQELPLLERLHISIFAADHGVAASGVSAYPQAVTTEMIRNFSRGGAAISVLARELGSSLEVINLGSLLDPGSLPNVLDVRQGPGTADFRTEPAMTEDQLAQCLEQGKLCIDKAKAKGCQLFIGGEMGIGNTTSASALASVLLKRPVAELVGPGTGLDAAGVAHKITVIEQALQQHQSQLDQPLSLLQHLGGFEIAGLVGAYLRCGQQGLPALVDGFICSAAALLACQLQPELQTWLFFSHSSAEPGHRWLLQQLAARPLLALDLRLGEGSGAALAVPLLRLACELHRQMATFAQAQVSSRD